MPTKMQQGPDKILYIHNSEKIGGGNRVLLGLIDRIDRGRYEPWSLLPARGPMEEELQKRGVAYFVQDVIKCATSGSSFSQMAAAVLLNLKIRKLNFTMLHAQGLLSYRIPAMLPGSSKLKRICHLHFPAAENANIAWALRKQPDLMIACSRHVADTYQNALNAAYIDVPIRVVHNFVDETFFCPGPSSDRLRSELSIPDSTSVVTIIGLVSERKGHPHFIAMARKLLEQRKNVRFLVVGEDIISDGYYRQKMEKFAKELQIGQEILFLGFRSDVLDIIRISDVVVLPSHAEGMPMTILEVGACAKPVVAYRIPGVDEVLQDGVNGYLVSENDIDGLAKAVEDILSDKNKKGKMGVRARKLIEEKFTLKSYAGKVESIYDTL